MAAAATSGYRVAWRTYLGLGLPNLVIGAWYYPVWLLLPPYLGELYSLTALGVAIILIRSVDLFTDTLLGRASDRLGRLSGGRLGRRKPMIAVGALLFGGSVAWLLFTELAGSGAVLFLVVSLLMLGESMMRVPYSALVAEIVTEYNARSRIVMVRMLFVFIGVLISAIFGAIYEDLADGDAAERFFGSLLPVIVMTPIIIPISLRLFREPEPTALEQRAQPAVGLITLSRQLLSMPEFVRVASAKFLHEFGDAIYKALAVYFMANALGLADDVSLNAVVSILLGIVSMLGITWLSHHVPKHIVLCIGVLGAIVAQLAYLLIPYGAATPLLMISGFSALFSAADSIMFSSMSADLVDVDRDKHGEDRAGLIAGVINSLGKVPEALGAGATFIVLAQLGFDPKEPLDQQRTDVVKWLFIFGPVFFKALVLGILWHYSLGKERQQALRDRIGLSMAEESPA